MIRPEKFTDYGLLQHFIDTQTVLYLPDGPIDLASKPGQLLGTIRAAIAGLERREIVERMRDAKESMRRAGKHAGGENSLPYGVGYSETSGWYYTAEAEKVKEAFRLFAAGETSYSRIGGLLNLARTNVRFILENPIYAGWRVYDEKRDPSSSAYVSRPNGRQGYRRKMRRSPDEIIRVRVLDGLVAQEDFDRVQQLIELKRHKHWRSQEGRTARYTYNGFLICGDCDSLIYTHASKHDFYQCKSMNPRERRKRALVGLERCSNRYMLREKLESRLDLLFGEKISDPDFLDSVLSEYVEQRDAKPRELAGTPQAVRVKIESLKEKRNRVLESFFDGIITKDERDVRIGELEREMAVFQRVLTQSIPQPSSPSTDEIQTALEPLAEWEFLEREDKRALLAIICPEIKVLRYTIQSVTLNLSAGSGGGYDGSRSKKAASPSLAPRFRSHFPRASCWPRP